MEANIAASNVSSALEEISQNQDRLNQKSIQLSLLMRQKIEHANTLQTQLNESNGKIKTLDETIDGLTTNVKEEKEQKERLASELQSVKTDWTTLQQTHDVTLAELERLRQQLQNSQGSSAEENDRLQEQLRQTKEDLQKATEANETLRQQHEQLKKDLETLQKNIQDVEKTLAEMKSRVTETEEALGQSKSECEKLREQLERERIERKKEIEEKDNEIHKVKTEKNAFEEKYKVAMKEKEEAKALVSELQEKVEALEKERDEQENDERDRLKKEIHNLKTKAGIDEQAKQLMKSTQAALEGKNEKLKAECAKLKKSSRSPAIDEKQKEAYKAKLKELQDGLDEYEELKEKLEKERVLVIQERLRLEKSIQESQSKPTPQTVVQIVQKGEDRDARYYRLRYESLASEFPHLLEKRMQERWKEQNDGMQVVTPVGLATTSMFSVFFAVLILAVFATYI